MYVPGHYRVTFTTTLPDTEAAFTVTVIAVPAGALGAANVADTYPDASLVADTTVKMPSALSTEKRTD